MQKSAPSVGRIALAVGFALSCFGLLLFLWVSFGGPVPLKSKSYRISAYFPEATQLAVESDVRIGGVSVGKVKSIEPAPADIRIRGQDTTEAEIEIEPQFAPIASDARATLRQKTLLGETYVELAPGSQTPAQRAAADGEGRSDRAAGRWAPVALGPAANVGDAEAARIESVPEGGSLGVGQVRDQTQIDEIFNALDEETRLAFQRWQQGAAVAIRGRGLDLNDALGNLGPFIGDASDVLAVLRRQKQQLQGLVRDSGVVFDALSSRGQQLAGAIRSSNETFGALASEEGALRDVFQVAPTFESEARLTLQRLDELRRDAHPLVRELLPVASDVSPTLRSVRRLSPPLRSLFGDLDALTRASRAGFPALADVLEELRPALRALNPFLANLNPVVAWLSYYRTSITDFLSTPASGLAGQLSPIPGQPAPRHALKQLGYISQESLAVYPNRLPTNRGNGYLQPFDQILSRGAAARNGIFPNFDCDHIGGERLMGDGGSPTVSTFREPNPPSGAFAPCYVAPDFAPRWGGTHFPQIRRAP